MPGQHIAVQRFANDRRNQSDQTLACPDSSNDVHLTRVGRNGSADAVTYWNEVTVNTVATGRAGVPGLLDIALVQAAVHDAVQSIEGRFE